MIIRPPPDARGSESWVWARLIALSQSPCWFFGVLNRECFQRDGCMVTCAFFLATTHLEIVTIAVSILALLLSVISLGWNIYRDVILKPRLWEIEILFVCLKHPAFAAEREWRLVNYYGPDDPTPMKFRQRTSMMSRHLP